MLPPLKLIRAQAMEPTLSYWRRCCRPLSWTTGNSCAERGRAWIAGHVRAGLL